MPDRYSSAVEEQEKQSVQPVTSAETVAIYPGEKNNLPYDVVVQTLRTEETTPPVQNTPVSIPIDEKWQEFPSVADAEQASYEEYKENLRRNARNFRITNDDLGIGGPKAKFQDNMAAIHLLKNLEQEGLQASPEQQEILSRYVGWGGLPDAFDESKPTWSGEFAELRSTLTPEEYTAARASTLNAHYTSPTVIRAIYEAVGNMGFQTGNILEPSMGVGNFFGMLPEKMRSSRLYGVELDSITGRIAKQLYPKANITVAGFETTDRRDFFDLAIGNVPFGQYKVSDPAYNKLGFLYTKMRNVADLSTTDAQKSSDMFGKCRYMDELTGNRGVVFATGTPVSNSMTELYTMQRYLQYAHLEEMHMTHFDCRASRFGETVTALELAPEGKGYRPRTRFSRFFNLPELMNLFKEVADVKTADQLHLPVPEVAYHNVVAKPTEVQKGLVQELSERAAAIHSGSVDPSTDNMLKVTSDGRKLGLDQRIINPDFPDQEGSKVNLCVENILQVWKDGEADKLTQLVFCDSVAIRCYK